MMHVFVKRGILDTGICKRADDVNRPKEDEPRIEVFAALSRNQLY